MKMDRRFLTLVALAGTLAACSASGDEQAEASAEPVNVAAAEPVEPVANTIEAPTAAANIIEPAANASAPAEAEPEKKEEKAEVEKPKAAEAEKPAPAPAPVVAAAPPTSFARCAVCHDATKGGPNKLGPNLYGTFGKQAGTHGSFAYSDALKGSGLSWDEATLDKWLENPRTLVAGNRMSFPGLKDAAKRKEIIDYMKALK